MGLKPYAPSLTDLSDTTNGYAGPLLIRAALCGAMLSVSHQAAQLLLARPHEPRRTPLH